MTGPNHRWPRAALGGLLVGLLASGGVAAQDTIVPDPALSPDAVAPDPALSPEQINPPPVRSPYAVRPDAALAGLPSSTSSGAM